MTSQYNIIESTFLRFEGSIFQITSKKMFDGHIEKSIQLKNNNRCFKSEDNNHLSLCNAGTDCSEYNSYMEKAICYMK